VLTDRNPPKDSDGVTWVSVGDQTRNRGIVAFAEDQLQGKALLRIEGESAVHTAVVIRMLDLNGQLLETLHEESLALGSSSLRVLIDTKGLPSDAVLVATLSEDANPLDNEAVLIRSRGAVQVSVSGSQSDPLVRALAAHPRVEIVQSDSLGAAAAFHAAGERPSLFLRFHSAESQRTVQGDLLFGAGTHTRTLGRGLRLKVTNSAPHVDGEVVYARIGETPVLIQRSDDLLLLVDEIDPDWAQDPSFPLLIGAMIDELTAPSSAASCEGGIQRIVVPPGAVQLVCGIGPREGLRVLEVQGGESLQIEEPGLCRLLDRRGDVLEVIAVSVCCAMETKAAFMLRAHPELLVAAQKSPDTEPQSISHAASLKLGLLLLLGCLICSLFSGIP
jgi:hypothetical protein